MNHSEMSLSDHPVKIDIPCSRDLVKNLRVGQPVLLSGRIVTGRDMAHRYLFKSRPAELGEVLAGSFIYHCGPVMVRNDNTWKVVSAGPTTSIREEPYQGDVIREYDLCGVIGKGGMGPLTMGVLKETGSVYLHATGGAGALLAACVDSVQDVYCLDEFGVPEAMWVLQVRNFPAIVTMDSAGCSLHRHVEADSRERLDRML